MILGSLRTPFAPYFLLVGLSPDETLAGQVRLLEGRWFEPGKKELALGHLAAQELGYRVGNRIALSSDLIFSITGIYSFGYKMTDSSASMDIQDAQSLLNWDDSVNMAFIHVGDPVHTRQIIDKINQEYPHLYASAGGDVVDQIRLFDSFDLFAWIISAASMLTCCLIVTNTLVMAVSERTREFGILMAIGWNRWMIYRTIFYEGLLLSILGCITGTVLAVVSLHLLQVSRRAGIGLIEATLPLDTIVGVHLIALILAGAASLYPATITLRLSPAQALRHE
jgi:putative ABC transport system permease protein